MSVVGCDLEALHGGRITVVHSVTKLTRL